MNKRGAIGAIGVLSAAVFLAGCSGGGPRSSPGIAALPANSGIQGAWVDQAGTGVTNFTNDGRFETFATDSGQKLSEGTYRYRDQVLVEITGVSIIRQSPVAFNCSVANISQLNCTSSGGQQFVLTRRASGIT